MPDAEISDNFLRNGGTMYDAQRDEWHFSQMEVRNMCTQCYCFLSGLSPKKLSRLIQSYKKEKARSYSRKPGSGRRRSDASIDCERWFKELIDMMGEPAPDSHNIYLPPGTRADYLRQYQEDRAKKPQVKKSSFYHMWDTQFPNLKTQDKPRLGKCVFCMKYRALLDAERNPKVLFEIILECRSVMESKSSCANIVTTGCESVRVITSVAVRHKRSQKTPL